MRAPLEETEDEEDTGTKADEDVEEEVSEEKLRFADKYGLDIDAEFRTKKFKARFQNWQDVAKVATEILLDEMRTLLERGPQLSWHSSSICHAITLVVFRPMSCNVRLHYDDVAGQKKPEKKTSRKGGVFASVAYAHRRQLNQKLVLPRRVKDILRCPADEEKWPKLKLLCEAVRNEIERVEDVYLNSEADIERLALAVEGCVSEHFGDEVGSGFKPIPKGSRLQFDEPDAATPIATWRSETAALVRGLHVGTAVNVKLRPMGTCRQPPLDGFAKKELMKSSRKGGPPRRFETVAQGRSVQKMRDLLLIALSDALFLTACEHWTLSDKANTSAADAWELGWWFNRGQELGSRPLFNGICAGRLFNGVCICAYVTLCIFGMASPATELRPCAVASFTNLGPRAKAIRATAPQ